jgi:hypothetical protein
MRLHGVQRSEGPVQDVSISDFVSNFIPKLITPFHYLYGQFGFTRKQALQFIFALGPEMSNTCLSLLLLRLAQRELSSAPVEPVSCGVCKLCERGTDAGCVGLTSFTRKHKAVPFTYRLFMEYITFL